MDPYIEVSGLWDGFHQDLIQEIKRTLARFAPERYLVRTGERSYLVLVESEGKVSHPFLPDVSVTTPQKERKSAKKKGGTAVVEPERGAEPLILRPFIEEEHREAFVEIYEAKPEQRLVTTIEVLSPSNKRAGSPGRELYQRKRQSVLLSNVSLVEIDLLRGGERMPMLDPWPDSPYTLMVSRAQTFRRCLVWSAHFQKPLPPIPVPLIKPDPDILLDLQHMIDAIYKQFRYDQSIDYTRPLTPPLSPEQTTWLAQRLRARQRQT
jgi:hypothetical protein